MKLSDAKVNSTKFMFMDIINLPVVSCLSQAYSSVDRANLHLREHKDLARHINTLVFHTKMVDYLDEMLVATSDLSIYWYV